MNVAGKVAVVTGGAGGIGSALVEALAERGAQVVVADLDRERTAAVVAAVEAQHPGRATAIACDAASEQSLRDTIAHARDAFGPVDLFFANAGVPAATGLETTDAQWQQALDVNVLGHVRAARLLMPSWLERGSGYFVATASAAGLLTQIGSAAYSVSKHAAVAFAEWLAITYGDAGVRVSCLCPMGVNTAMLADGLASDRTTERAGAEIVAATGDVLEPHDVAACVMDAVAAERFLILPHPQVGRYVERKAADEDRWLAGMRRLQASL
ncbi:MAG: putative short-chain type dehydrogenase/reductase y4lA [Solirubrobacterales bacterium]|nr:putative short-chain type dehydrogenase/reductase y4lA [Solirubrobacterales bacterium]